MAEIISGTFSNGYTVSDTPDPFDNPVTITASAYLTNPFDQTGDGLSIIGDTNWSVFNSGRIRGPNFGVYVDGGKTSIAGYLSNSVIGYIDGQVAGIETQRTFSVRNAGDIVGYQFGVQLATATVANLSTGTITGLTRGSDGILASGPGYVTNAGLVTGSYGVYLRQGGTVSNQSIGLIRGSVYGVSVKGKPGSVVNSGDIASGVPGTGISGVVLSAGGGVSNQLTGMISGPFGVYGVLGGAGVTVTNAGLISGTSHYAVWLRGGGGITNLSTGTISGSSQGIAIGGTVFNAGTIGGGTYAVDFAVGAANVLIDAPGAVFSGAVNGGNAVGGAASSALELASGASAGQISGLGSQFTNFSEVVVAFGSQWTLTGANGLAAGTSLVDIGVFTVLDGTLNDAGNVIDDGLIQADAATLAVGTLTGTGEVLISGDGSLEATGSVAAGVTVAFAGGGLLALVPGKFSGQIDGIGGGGRIGLIGITDATSAGIINNNTLAIQQSAGPTLDLTLDPTQSYANVVFPVDTVGGFQLVEASAQSGPTVIDQGETKSLTGAAGSTLAAIAGALGGITVTGTDSLLITTAGAFIVGDTSLGGLSIEAGGTANAQSGLLIANTAAASGSSVGVSGAGSNLDVTGSLVVGDAGSGSLSLSEGGSVTAGALVVGAAATGDGAVSLAGAGTTLTVTGSLTLGDQAAGELSILGGAQITIAGGVVGSSETAPGNLDVEGSGSQLTINAGTLTVGANGPAEFTLGIGATLRGELANGRFGVVSEYGTVDPATDPNDGTQNVGFGNSLIYDFHVANSGTIKITSGTASFFTPLATDETDAADGSTGGLWMIGADDTLVMNATSVDNTQTFDFTSPSAAALVIGQVPRASTTQTGTFNGQTMPALTGSVAPGAANVLPGWDAPIENFQSGDLIVLRGLTYGSATASGDVVTVWTRGGGQGSALGSLTFVTESGAASSTDASLAATRINSLACFARGTRIATADGWVKVENLRVRDRVVTHDGGIEPIVWIGRRSVNCPRHPVPGSVFPVRIARGAFGENVPVRDLYVSPNHAIFVHDVLVPANLLVNGTSIVQVERPTVTYFHVELRRHAVILAEGLPVESYLDIGDRADFDGGETIGLLPAVTSALTPESASVWEMRGAAPLVMTGEALAGARRLVAANAWRHPSRSAVAIVSGSRPHAGHP